MTNMSENESKLYKTREARYLLISENPRDRSQTITGIS